MCYVCFPLVLNSLDTGEHACPGPVNVGFPLALPQNASMDMARQTIDWEVSVAHTESEAHQDVPSIRSFTVVADIAILSLYHSMQTHPSPARRVEFTKTILEGLRWRFKMQRQLLFAMLSLLQANLITPESVMREINFDLVESHRKILAIKQRLEAFQFVRDMGSVPLVDMDPEDVLKRNFTLPVLWLAVLIARSDKDFGTVIMTLEQSGHLGLLDKQALKKNLLVAITNNPNPNEFDTQYIEPAADGSGGKSSELMVGFWLPHGQHLQIWAKSTLARYIQMIQAYGIWWGEGTWGDESGLDYVLTTIEQQGVCQGFPLPWK